MHELHASRSPPSCPTDHLHHPAPTRNLQLANFTPFELKAAGVSQKELLAIGFSRADIKTQ